MNELIGVIEKHNYNYYVLDNPTISDKEFDALYDRIGFVTQKAVLFAGDIKKNVLFGESRGEKTDENAYEALEAAQAKEFVDKLAGGINSPIAQGGTNVSGGQKQRVAIARAIAQAPPIILADEPTGNLDSNSSREIMDILKNLHKEGRTVILITHDSDIAMEARRIIHIKDGKIDYDEIKENGE